MSNMVVRIIRSVKTKEGLQWSLTDIDCKTKAEAVALVRTISGGISFHIGTKFVDRGRTVRTVYAAGK